MTDAEILQEIAKGNKKAFKQLYDLFNGKVYNTAISYAQNQADAEEITQDVFVKIHKSAAKFKGNSSVSTWIYRITINTSITFVKRKNRFKFLAFNPSEMIVPDFEHPGILLEKKEHAKVLFKAIEKLPTQQKTAFILSFIEGLPRKEVAQIMETSLKSVEALLQRGKKNLRETLGKYYPNRRKKK